MEIPNLSLHFLVQELQPILADSRVSKIQSIGKGAFKFKLSTKAGTRELVLAPNAFFLTEFRLPSATENQNLVELMRKHLTGRIVSVSQKNWDRIVVLEFGHAKLVLELFASGNLVLIGEDGKVIASLHKEEWKDRKVQRGATYQFPASKPVPSELSLAEFQKLLQKNPQKIVSALMSEFNLFPGLAEEAVLSLGIEKETIASSIPEKTARNLHEKLAGFFSDSKTEPQTVQTKKGALLLPFAFPHWLAANQLASTPVETLNKAVDSFFGPGVSSTEKTEAETGQNKKIQRLLHALEEQKTALQKLEQQSLENQRKGEWIFTHYAELQGIIHAIERAEAKKIPKKQMLETLRNSGLKGFEIASQIEDWDPKKKRAIFEASA